MLSFLYLNALSEGLTYHDSDVLIGSSDVDIVLADFSFLAHRLAIPFETRDAALIHVWSCK